MDQEFTATDGIFWVTSPAMLDPDGDGVLVTFQSGAKTFVSRWPWEQFRESVEAALELLGAGPPP